MNEFVRVALGVLAAAATPAVILAGADLASRWPPYSWEATAALFSITFSVALAHALFLGLPLYFVLRLLGLTAWWISLVCGFIIGRYGPVLLVPWLVVRGNHRDATFLDYNPANVALGILGMLAALAAWLTWYVLGRRISGPRRDGR